MHHRLTPEQKAMRREALRPLFTATGDVLLKSSTVCARWDLSRSHLLQERRAGRGLESVRLMASAPIKGTLRFKLSSLVEAELLGVCGPLGVELVLMGIATCPHITFEVRAALQAHVRKTLKSERVPPVAGRLHLPISPAISREPAFEPLADLLKDRFVTAKELAARWSINENTLASHRKAGWGLPFIRLRGGVKEKRGSIRYRESEIKAAEARGGDPNRFTLDDVVTAISSFSRIPREARVQVWAHLRRVLAIGSREDRHPG
jgi:hypothetical protein